MKALVLGIFVVAAMFMGACSNSSVSTHPRGSSETLSDAMVNNSKEAFDKFKNTAKESAKAEVAEVVAEVDSTLKLDSTAIKAAAHAIEGHKDGEAHSAEPAKK